MLKLQFRLKKSVESRAGITRLLEDFADRRKHIAIAVHNGENAGRHYSSEHVGMADVTRVSLLYRIRDAEDLNAWAEFSALYGKLIHGWLRRHGVQTHDADDLVQEVMAFVHREISGFEHTGRIGAFRRWLRQVTVNRMRDFWRSRDRRTRREGVDIGSLADQLADDASGVSRIWREEYDRYVVDHLLTLIERQFQPQSVTAFRQIVLEERPASEVAEQLGISLGAARVAQSRVLAALRKVGEGLID